MHVSNVSIAIIIFNMALGLLFPIVLMLVVKSKYQLGVKPFFLGCPHARSESGNLLSS